MTWGLGDVEAARWPGGTEPGQLTVTVVGGVDDIGAADWAAVTAGRGFYSSPPWLRLVQEDPWYDVWYLVAREDGRVLGILPVYLSSGRARDGIDGPYDPAAVFIEPGGMGDPARWRPALLAGGRTGHDTELLLRPDLPAATRRRVLAAMIARMTRLADTSGVQAGAFMYLTSEAAAELAPVTGLPPLLADVTATVPLDGCRSFDDHLDRLPGPRRRRIRHEIREFAESGFTVRQVRLAGSVSVIAPLLAADHGRYGLGDTPQMLAAHLSQHAEHLDALSHVLLCEHAGRPVGALLAYEWQDAWYARAVGTSDGLRGRAAAFFNLAYYEPIRLAIERGMHRYVLGPSTIAAKVKRGAVLEPRWSVLLGRSDLASSVRRRSTRWNDTRLDHWDSELRSIGHPDASGSWRAAVDPALVR